MSRILLLTLATATLAIGTKTRRAEACIDSSGSTWEQDAIPVYALTGGASAYRLQDVPTGPTGGDSLSASDWQSIIETALNIYREESPLPRRLYFAGHVADYAQSRYGIVIRGEPESATCNGALAQSETNRYWYNPYEYSWSSIEFRQGQNDTGVCEPIPWTPNRAPGQYDITGTLVHELFHSLGYDHTDICGDSSAASVLVGGYAVAYNRHLTRYDKGELVSLYGMRSPLGKSRTYTDLANVWSGTAPWPDIAGLPAIVIGYRPKSLTQFEPNTYVAWGAGTTGAMYRAKRDTSGIWTLQPSVSTSTWSSPAVVSNGSGLIRNYFLGESSTSAAKYIRWRESADGGVTWGPLVASFDGLFSVATRRDGIAAAYDTATNSFAILYTTDGTNLNSVVDTKGNDIRVVVDGPGATDAFDSPIGHNTFGTPSIACAPSNASDRCLVSFGTGELRPTVRWIEGRPLSNGHWATYADRSQSSIRVDFSPSVGWSNAGQRFVLAAHRRTGTTTTTTLYYKLPTPGSTWLGPWAFSGSSPNFSAGTFGSTIAPSQARLYYSEYAE